MKITIIWPFYYQNIKHSNNLAYLRTYLYLEILLLTINKAFKLNLCKTSINILMQQINCSEMKKKNNKNLV